MMLTYQEYEKSVFDFLMSKHRKNPEFRFSLRQKANKGAETDYFIGTQNSRYFGTTFWTIPIAYPGSSMDLIDVFFIIRDNEKYDYYIEFNQTKKPHNKQNKSALELIRKIKPIVKKQFSSVEESTDKNKMETFDILSPNLGYTEVNDMFLDLETDLQKLFPIIDKEIQNVTKVNKQFIGHRIRQDEFNKMFAKLENRVNKYGNSNAVSEVPQKVSYDTTKVLNQILFGPPGTGKTYNSINKALEIINDNEVKKLNWSDREAVKKLFDTKLNEGQIVFTTFHQSMSYEDFIEGIKPIEPKQEGQPVIYKIVDGIFKKACAFAAYNSYRLFTKSNKQSDKYSFDDLYEAFIESIQDQIDKKTPPVYKTLRGRDVEVKEINKNDSIIARAKNSIAKSSAPLTKENMQKLYDRFKTIEEIEDLNQVQETVQVTPRITEFYAVFSGLKQFEKTFKPDEQLMIENKEIEALDFDEIQKKFNAGVYKEAIKTFGKEADPVVMIIDEINRGNVSQIFGELITLIEEDKRLGKEEALEADLPYSKQKFGVPPNLYIIGTMNTADRSVEALDAALRRRFSFEEMRPRPELVSPQRKLWELWWSYPELDWNQEPYASNQKNLFDFLGIEDDFDPGEMIWNKINKEGKKESQVSYFNNVTIKGINLETLLSTINKRIEKLLDKDHQIGHSYFMPVNSMNSLKQAFQYEIIPLLQEYFFGDYGKIGMILGKGFVRKKGWDNKVDSFAAFDSESSGDFDEREVFELIDYTKEDSEYTIELNKKQVVMDFEKAIRLLLNQEIE